MIGGGMFRRECQSRAVIYRRLSKIGNFWYRAASALRLRHIFGVSARGAAHVHKDKVS
ncbi:uncharacterized protein FFMR_06983 [Fusarium fujikuroi]|nr:uncharacterized protein FFMR_06983 [Fusarium fujikuroi]SCV32185.1 uncharacterized protein FFFS_03167 [Fusarium fujikuroi]SCV51845.1 uncharacterized protein FFB14_12263 [Fusarium fujikuroi]